MTIIADLIRAGVAPELVQRVSDAIADAAAGRKDVQTPRQLRNARYYVLKRLKASYLDAKEPPSLPLDGSPNGSPIDNITLTLPITPPSSPNPSQENLSVNGCAKTAQDLPSESLFELDEQPRSPRNNFVRFYEAYPKHVNRKAACSKFETAVKAGVDPEHIISAARRYAEACLASFTEKRYIPAPDRWLHSGGYDDEDLPLITRMNGHHDPPIAGRSNGMRGFHENVQRMIEEEIRKDAQEQGDGSA
jgi:Fe-S oxidoreductase